VIADVEETRSGWGDFGPVSAIPEIYTAAAQFGDDGFRMVHTWVTPKWVVRAGGSRSSIEASMQQAVASVDPALPFAEFRGMDEVRSAAFGMQRLETTVLTTLAGLALLLAAVGIYGIIAHSVVERTREFGIRLALGSTRWQAVASAAGSGIALAALGAAFGLLLSLWAGKLVRTLIWGVKPNDALTLATVTAVLLSVAVVAAFVPALRIARIDPAITLRDE
jgi:ABC-type antimicrobial peptide transport system permease subunit